MAASEAANHSVTKVQRHWSISKKRRIVELTLRKDASVSEVALAHGIHATVLSHWRSLYRSGKLDANSPQNGALSSAVGTKLLPVTIATEQEGLTQSCESNVVHLTLASGATLRLEANRLDVALVCALLAELRR